MEKRRIVPVEAPKAKAEEEADGADTEAAGAEETVALPKLKPSAADDAPTPNRSSEPPWC